MLPDVSRLRVRELLQVEASVVVELRQRGLVRTNNKPLGDIAEQVVLAARGGVLEPNSTKSHDVTDPGGRRIQVKAMGGRTAGKAGKFSPFRSFDFDTAVFLVFELQTFELALAREVNANDVEAVSRYSAHTNGRQPTLRQIENAGIDVTDEMRAAYAALDGDAVALPFRHDVPAILEGWLLGQAGGTATADVLFGRVNPSGRLAETIPLRLEDNPSYGSFPGEFGHVRYGEGILVGYRGYDARGLDVAFPFGHGLSYTTFSYSDPSAVVTADGDVDVTVRLTNTGPVAGREVVQVYVGRDASAVQRAPRALAGFASVELAPGQSRSVTIRVERRDLAYWDVRVDRWVVEPGAYTFEVGASSRDLCGSVAVALEGDLVVLPISLNSTIGELADHPVAGAMARQILEVLDQAGDGAAEMMASVPIGRVATFPGMPITLEQVRELIDTANSDLA